MGIQGLLPLLKSIMTPIHIKELEGRLVAVDTYSWLHKGALSCSTDLCKGQPTSKHIDYCMHRVNMLRHYGVKPILIFDGGPLPMKSDQEIKRARSRRENLARAMEHESNGNRTAAYECYQKAVDISPLVAYDLIQVLKLENVPYIVAPYEADAQMTFLALNKQVDAVITEDSDLIAFGCPRIIYKMDKFGQGVEFKNSMIQHNKELNLAGFTQLMLLEMCILSGCDYLPSLPGMGLKKAHTLMKKFKSHDKVLKHLKFNNIEVTPLYEESFRNAILTFKHQRVYDPVTEDIVYLSELEDLIREDSNFLGPSLPQHIAKGIALGDLDPFTKTPIQREYDAAAEKVLGGNYQLKTFNPNGEKKKLDLPAQKNLLTNYFCFASLEAKQKFKAPRITLRHPMERNGISNPHKYTEKYGIKTNYLDFPEAQHHGPNDAREVTDYNKMLPFSTVHEPVCKPCISLHKDLDSNQENAKTRPANKNVIVRSSYFMNKPREQNCNVGDKIGDDKFDNVVTSPPVLIVRKEEKKVIVKSSYFQHNTDEQNNECKLTVDTRKTRVRSSYFQEISVNENNEEPESPDFVTRDEDSLECTMRKRLKTDSPTENANDNNSISGMSSPGSDEETEGEQGKFGCNINHLGQYSNIAEKSMEKFVSMISSFKYNSSGSRASGLRPPLKEIKNNCIKSSTPDVDLNKFMYVPSQQKAPPPRRRKSKA